MVANIANEIYSRYADALGISPLPKALSYLGMSTGHGATAASMNMHSANVTAEENKLDLSIPRNVTNELDYQTALGLISRAQYALNNNLKPLSTSNLTDTINDVNNRFSELGKTNGIQMNLNETINTLTMIVSMRMAQDIKYTKVRKKEKMCLLFDLAIHFSAHGII